VENSWAREMDMERFLMENLRSRVSRRVLAEQHLALTQQLVKDASSAETDGTRVGIVDTAASAEEMAQESVESARRMTAERLRMDVEDLSMVRVCMPEKTDEVRFACIPGHVKYVLHEVLCNSLRFTVQKYTGKTVLPEVVVTVVEGEKDVVFRVSDQAGGFENTVGGVMRSGRVPTMMERSYDAGTDGLGLGLMMGRVYAEYWDGRLMVESLPGWGSDVYIKLGRLGNRMENLGGSKV